MPLTAGAHLGPYEILAAIGAGGMGEVYKARDTRLDRTVAIKILPSDLAADPDLRARFEREARAIAALDHPHICAIYDIGEDDGTRYLVMPHLDGETLAVQLAWANGPLPVEQALKIGVEIANALDKAHRAGITHRDLKPSNVMLTKTGAKLLDFGLAKIAPVAAADTMVTAVPAPERSLTGQGLLVGTLHYMSPEQVEGKFVDARTDIFSFGAVLFEMLTGRKAFDGGSSARVMAAILTAQPPSLSTLKPALPTALPHVVETCLVKDPDGRWQSIGDVARELRWIVESDVMRSPIAPPDSPRRLITATDKDRRWIGGFVASAVALLALGMAVGRFSFPYSLSSPHVTRLTFERGTVSSARFTTDGKTVVYGAAWGGEPTRIFQTRLGTPESTAVQLPEAELLAISATGELAISASRHLGNTSIVTGTLARAPLVGGSRRDVLDTVTAADWSRDGSQFAVVRRVDGKDQLEYPIGTPLYETRGFITDPRIGPDGDAVAFFDHSEVDREAQLVVVTIGKQLKRLGPTWAAASGLAWSPNGREIWFTAGDSAWSSDASLRSVTREGVLRPIWSVPLGLTLHDIAPDGRVLLTGRTTRNYIAWLDPDRSAERDISWFSLSAIQDLSVDGTSVLLTRQDEGAGRNREFGLRHVEPPTAVRLGPGNGIALSFDGKWALARLLGDPSTLLILPTGAGQPRQIATPGFQYLNAGWFPDGKRIVFIANTTSSNSESAAYLQDIDGGTPRRIASASAFMTGTAAPLRVSPDGRWFTGPQKDGPPVLLPVGGGEPRYPPGLTADDRPLNWSADGKAIFVERAVPDKRWMTSIVRYDLTTSQVTPVRQIEPSDVAGISNRPWCLIAPDGRSIAYVINRHLNDLYVVEGLK